MAALPVPPLPPPPPGVPPPGLLPPPIGIPMHRQLPPATPRQSALPPSNVVLLTGIPKQLHQVLSSWILPCGPARTILWYPKQFEKDETMDTSKKSMALVTMMHGDGAWKLVHTLTALKSDLGDLEAHMVPASPDIPLPPIVLDDSIAKPLQQLMKNSFHAIQAGKFQVTAIPTLEQQQQQPLLDSYKVAAAAGGHNYDEDADPLNAPAVLQAVREFRASLHKTSAVQQARRIALVQERLEKTMKALLHPPPAAAVATTVASGVPPLGGLVPPPPPPPGSGFDSGKRGQSNLPAWMTTEPSPPLPPPPPVPFTTTNQQSNSDQQQQPHQSDDEPLTKKPKLSVPIDETLLRAHVAQQIAHYMGEEDATLINFCVKHVLALTSPGEQTTTMANQKVATWEELTSELQQVLEEDTSAFVEELQRKVKELSGER